MYACVSDIHNQRTKAPCVSHFSFRPLVLVLGSLRANYANLEHVLLEIRGSSPNDPSSSTMAWPGSMPETTCIFRLQINHPERSPRRFGTIEDFHIEDGGHW